MKLSDIISMTLSQMNHTKLSEIVIMKAFDIVNNVCGCLYAVATESDGI